MTGGEGFSTEAFGQKLGYFFLFIHKWFVSMGPSFLTHASITSSLQNIPCNLISYCHYCPYCLLQNKIRLFLWCIVMLCLLFIVIVVVVFLVVIKKKKVVAVSLVGAHDQKIVFSP